MAPGVLDFGGLASSFQLWCICSAQKDPTARVTGVVPGSKRVLEVPSSLQAHFPELAAHFPASLCSDVILYPLEQFAPPSHTRSMRDHQRRPCYAVLPNNPQDEGWETVDTMKQEEGSLLLKYRAHSCICLRAYQNYLHLKIAFEI